MFSVKFKKLHPDAQAPVYNDRSDAGADLRSVEDIEIEPGSWSLVRTGIAVELPSPEDTCAYNYMIPEVQIRSRSGLALKHGVFVLNSPGTIDANYTDEWGVILFNAGKETFIIKKGDRIAQMVFSLVEQVSFHWVDEIDTSRSRGGGFGSTGVT